MTRLALLAVLLLALAPAVGRVLAAGSTQVLAGWSELCTSLGLQSLPSEARALDGTPLPAPGAPGGGECAYCPLAAALSLLLLPCLALAWHAAPAPAGAPPPAPPGRRLLHGPGSRGPPILL